MIKIFLCEKSNKIFVIKFERPLSIDRGRIYIISSVYNYFISRHWLGEASK